MKTECVVLRNIYVYTNTHIHPMGINEKRRQEFEREKGKLYRRVWREERKGKN